MQEHASEETEMRRRSTLAAVALVTFASVARAGDWAVEKQVDGVPLDGIGDLTLSGDDVVVAGFGRAWLLRGDTGETISTCLDVLSTDGTTQRYLATVDVLVAAQGEDAKVYEVRNGTPLSTSVSASFGIFHGALFSLSGADRPSVARIEPMGRTGWVQEVDPSFGIDTLAISKQGIVLGGPGGFLELDAAGKELRSWRMPEAERATLRADACRTQVVDDLVLLSTQLPDGEAKLRVFKGKRPRELSLRGQTAPGVVCLSEQGREPFVIQRGSKEWVLIEVEHGLPGAQPDGTHGYVAVDLGSRLTAGPKVVAQRSLLSRSGHTIQSHAGGAAVDLITGETTPRPAGSSWGVTSTFWYQLDGSTLTYAELVDGEPRTLQLPPMTTLDSELVAIPDLLTFRAGGASPAGRSPASVGTIDLGRGRIDVLQTLGDTHTLQVSDCVVTNKAAFFVVWVREGATQWLRIIRRDR
jgi:hypothetical protein